MKSCITKQLTLFWELFLTRYEKEALPFKLQWLNTIQVIQLIITNTARHLQCTSKLLSSSISQNPFPQYVFPDSRFIWRTDQAAGPLSFLSLSVTVHCSQSILLACTWRCYGRLGLNIIWPVYRSCQLALGGIDSWPSQSEQFWGLATHMNGMRSCCFSFLKGTVSISKVNLE